MAAPALAAPALDAPALAAPVLAAPSNHSGQFLSHKFFDPDIPSCQDVTTLVAILLLLEPKLSGFNFSSQLQVVDQDKYKFRLLTPVSIATILYIIL